MSRSYWVYIMTNPMNSVLYTGMTNNLSRRIQEHKEGFLPGFSSKYHTIKLVYAEETNEVDAAIAREKQIKGWLRKKKITLIESLNPAWKDLADYLT